MILPQFSATGPALDGYDALMLSQTKLYTELGRLSSRLIEAACADDRGQPLRPEPGVAGLRTVAEDRIAIRGACDFQKEPSRQPPGGPDRGRQVRNPYAATGGGLDAEVPDGLRP